MKFLLGNRGQGRKSRLPQAIELVSVTPRIQSHLVYFPLEYMNSGTVLPDRNLTASQSSGLNLCLALSCIKCYVMGLAPAAKRYLRVLEDGGRGGGQIHDDQENFR